MKKWRFAFILLFLITACTLNPPSIHKAPMEPMPWDMTAAAQRNPEAWISVEEIQYTPMPIGGGGGTILVTAAEDINTGSCLGKLYLAHVDGTGSLKLTDIQNTTGATWSPDGSLLAYIDLTNGNLYIRRLQNSKLDRTTLQGSEGTTWSPDGTKLAVTSSFGLSIHSLETFGREFYSFDIKGHPPIA